MDKIERIARIAHEVNRAYCAAVTGEQHAPWSDVSDELRGSVRAGVRAHLERRVSPQLSHQNWMEYKAAHGWRYGPVKDEAAKTHPNMVPWDQLSLEQRVKDFIFAAVVAAAKDEVMA